MASSLIFALSLIGSLQDADPKISYKTVAVPLARALEEISRSTGKSLKATPSNENEIVVINVKDVTLSKLKEKLATVTLSKWTAQSDGLEILAIDSVARDAMARQEVAKKVANIQESLNNLAAALKPKSANKPKTNSKNPDEEEYEPEYGERDVLLALATRNLRAADLAKLGEGERWVYSTAPNAMQKPLVVGDMAKSIESYIKAHNESIITSGNAEDGMDAKMKAQMEKIQKVFGSYRPRNNRITGTPSKLNLIVTNRNSIMSYSGLGLTLEGYDRNGQVIFSESNNLSNMAMPAEAVMDTTVVAKEAKDDKQDAKLSKKVEYSAMTKELRGSMNFFDPGATPKPLSKELLERLMRPDLYDPLSFEVSESIFALAESEGANLVANVPDESMDYSMISEGGEITTIGAIKSRFDESSGIVSQIKDGWMTIQPGDTGQLQSSRLNRVAFAKFLGSASRSSVVSLDALADYAVSNPPLTESQIAMPYLLNVAPSTMSGMMRGGQDWSMLRLWGNLSVADRNALKSGKTLLLAANSPKVKSLVRSMVFGAETNLQSGPQEEPLMAGIFSVGRGMRNGAKSSYKEEPTELLPAGIPGNATLAVTMKSGQFLQPDSETGGFAKMFGSLGAEEYAMIKYMSTDSRMADAAAFMPKMKKFKVGDRDNIDFKIQLVDDVVQKYYLMDSRMSSEAKTIDDSQLPSAFQDSVAKMMALYKDLFEGLDMPGFLGNGGVPPR